MSILLPACKTHTQTCSAHYYAHTEVSNASRKRHMQFIREVKSDINQNKALENLMADREEYAFHKNMPINNDISIPDKPKEVKPRRKKKVNHKQLILEFK